MKIAMVGSRTFCDKTLVYLKVDEWFINHPERELVSGGAKGVDTWAWEAVRLLKNICWIFPADWIKYGKSAGYIRNEEIVRQADHVVAFWDGESKGTKHTIDLAIKAGKPVDIYIRRAI
jgi:uncharacterized phage-like protein YoqJ